MEIVLTAHILDERGRKAFVTQFDYFYFVERVKRECMGIAHLMIDEFDNVSQTMTF